MRRLVTHGGFAAHVHYPQPKDLRLRMTSNRHFYYVY